MSVTKPHMVVFLGVLTILSVKPKFHLKLVLGAVLVLCLAIFFAFYTPQKGHIQSAKDVPLPSAIANGVMSVGLQPITESTRSLMSSTFRATYQFDSYQYSIVDTNVDWKSVQQAYDTELRAMGFQLDADVDSIHVSSWSRSRYFGLEGEQVVLIWQDVSDASQAYFVHFGINN